MLRAFLTQTRSGKVQPESGARQKQITILRWPFRWEIDQPDKCMRWRTFWRQRHGGMWEEKVEDRTEELLFTRRDESAGRDGGGTGDVMNSPKEQHWTSDRKCDEAQRPPSAYQTDDFSLSDVVLALSTTVRLNDNASG